MREKGRTARQRDQSRVDPSRAGRLREEDDAGEQIRADQRNPRHAGLVRAADKPRRFTVPRHEEQRPRRHVQRPVPGRDHADHDQGIDQVRRRQDPGVRQRDGQWRVGCLRGGAQQARVVVRDQDPDEEHRADVEDQDSPEYLPDGGWDGLSGVGRFAGGDSNPV
jgi:hypothetical protein